jgi:NADH-ubiquinone oxidoreductase chain 6
MNSIFLLNETFTNGYRADVLDIISLLAILSGILVIISKNPIVSVLFLIGLFLSIASYLMILGLNFLGLSYLLVYVGAVSILFLFILMLINVRLSELLSNTSNSIPLAILITISFNYPVYQILPNSIASFNSNTIDSNTTLGDT